ncbi:TPA: host cell division inhibitor Icd-like protein [Proteus mirabilis]
MMNIAANAYQVNDSLLAGNNSILANRSLTKNLVNQSAKIYANQSILTTNGGWDKGKHSKSEEFTPFIKGDFSHLSKVGKSRYLSSEIEFFESIKKGGQSATLGNVDIKYRASENYKNSIHLVIGKDDNLELIQKCAIHHLHLWVIVGYSDQALAKSSVRIETLSLQTATHDAPCVFFCVYAYAYLLNAVLYRSYSMVALVRQPSGWLVSVCASSLNLANVTTPIEIETSGGDSELIQTEIIVMMATPTHTQFKFLFLSIKRSDTTAKPCRIAVTAPNEHDARLMLVRDYILSFAGRLPAQEAAHA